jgi:hypothetical protein
LPTYTDPPAPFVLAKHSVVAGELFMQIWQTLFLKKIKKISAKILFYLGN